MIIGDNQSDVLSALAQQDGGARPACRRQHLASPAAQQPAHALQNGRFVVDDQGRRRQARDFRSRARHRLFRHSFRAALRQWQINGEHRPLAGGGFQYDRTLQNLGDPLDDGQPQPQALFLAAGFRQPREFAEHQLALVPGDARPGVVNRHPDAFPAPAAAHEHLARRGILDGVGQQVLEQSAQQPPVGAHPGGAGNGAQLQPLGARQRGHLTGQRQQDVVERKGGVFRLSGAGVEARDVQKGGEDVLHRFQRGVDVARQLALGAIGGMLHHGGGEESRGVQRLHDVVTGGGDETGLVQIGLFGFRLGPGQLAVEARQLRRALGDALFQQRIGHLQRLGGRHPLGDVGEGNHHAAAGHARGARLQHRAIGLEAHLKRLEGFRNKGKLARQRFLRRAGWPCRVDDIAQNVLQRRAHPAHVRRQPQQVAELPVPADQLVIAVEDADALAHVVDGRLQQVAVVLDGRRGVVEQLQRPGARGCHLLQQQRQHQPRGGRAHRRGQQMLGEAQQADVGVVIRLQLDIVAPRESVEGALGARLAQIARHRGLKPRHGDGRAPQPGRGHLGRIGRSKSRRLKPLRRGYACDQRHARPHERIDQHRPDDAVGQRIGVESEHLPWPQEGQPQRPVRDEGGRYPARIGERRQQQRIGPYGEARADAGHGPGGGRLAPQQAAKQRRGELRHGGE